MKPNRKKPPKNLTIKTKLEVIENLDKELSGREIAGAHDITESAVSIIKKREEKNSTVFNVSNRSGFAEKFLQKGNE